jgi:leader peptidase (prepilin peptidase) / N-methyltransferase
MQLLVVILIGVFGAMIGSFLNVVVWRVPRGESLSHPASHCPHCDHPIRPWDNIPVVSWLVLRARCRDCGAPISSRYPLVELGTALFFAAVAWWALSSGDLGSPGVDASLIAFALALIAYLYLAAISIALTLIDIDTQRLPNAIVVPAYGVGAVLLTASALIGGNPGALLTAAISMVGLFALYLVFTLVYPNGMGFGDVKLAGVLGLFLGYLGWGQLAVGAFGAFVLGGVFSVVLLIAQRAGRKTRIPFGPWMLAGAWVGIFIGEQLSTWYLGLFGLA